MSHIRRSFGGMCRSVAATYRDARALSPGLSSVAVSYRRRLHAAPLYNNPKVRTTHCAPLTSARRTSRARALPAAIQQGRRHPAWYPHPDNQTSRRLPPTATASNRRHPYLSQLATPAARQPRIETTTPGGACVRPPPVLQSRDHGAHRPDPRPCTIVPTTPAPSHFPGRTT